MYELAVTLFDCEWFWGWMEQHMIDYHWPITCVANQHSSFVYAWLIFVNMYVHILTSSSNGSSVVFVEYYSIYSKRYLFGLSNRCATLPLQRLIHFDQIFQLPTQFPILFASIDKTKIQCKHCIEQWTLNIERIIHTKQLQIECDCLNAIVAFQQLICKHQH